MVVAGSKPILKLASAVVNVLARVTPLPQSMAVYFLALSVLPLRATCLSVGTP